MEFRVIPDATTRALELRKRSADVVSNGLTPDTVLVLQKDDGLQILRGPGTIYAYLALNLRDPTLKDVRVRRALAYSINVEPIIHYLWRDQARPAYSILPPQHWAYDADVAKYPYDPAMARKLLDEAGYPEKNGVRFHLAMKTSTEESTRLLAAVLQQQLREVGIALDIHTFEFATFYSDITKGAYQLHSLRWVGGNLDPDIFEYVFATKSFAPKRANRTFYSNPRVDELIEQSHATLDQQQRKKLFDEIQQIVAEDLPYINLWYYDNVIVHTKRVHGIELNPAGNYDFLRTAEMTVGSDALRAAGLNLACYHRISPRPKEYTSLAHPLRWRHLCPPRAQHRPRATTRVAEAIRCRSDHSERGERRRRIRYHSSDRGRVVRTGHRCHHYRQSRLGQARDHRVHEFGERKRSFAGASRASSCELS